jgi:hypothetical protein
MGQTLATAQQYTCATDEAHDESDTLQPLQPLQTDGLQQTRASHDKTIQQTAKLFDQSLRGILSDNTTNTTMPDNPADSLHPVPSAHAPLARVYQKIVRATIDAMQQNLVDLRTQNDQLVWQNHILTQQLAGLQLTGQQLAGQQLPCDKKMNITLPNDLANDLHQPNPDPHHGHEPVV